MRKWKIKCIVCGKENTFGDVHDITFAKWHVVGWNVKTGEPKCNCFDCEYSPCEQEKKES